MSSHEYFWNYEEMMVICFATTHDCISDLAKSLSTYVTLRYAMTESCDFRIRHDLIFIIRTDQSHCPL